MSFIILKAIVLAVFLALVSQVAASPITSAKSQYAAHVIQSRSKFDIKLTSSTKHNVIDWVLREAQGRIANPPPPKSPLSGNASLPMGDLEVLSALGLGIGPEGTIPIPQVSSEYLSDVHGKGLPKVAGLVQKTRRQYAGKHWYVSSNQNVANIGGVSYPPQADTRAIYSLFKAFVQTNADFSLLQTAITHGSTKGLQTLEAGWINYPSQVSAPHLFTFYNTNGYASQANGQGGWNRDVTGWVQYDATIFPGTVFSTLSTDAVNGQQYDIAIEYLLHEGNWWLYVKDRWIGYYPASLFATGTTGASLATGSDMLLYYGETLNTEAALSSTDMGSGQYGTTGAYRSAYIRNMVYTDSSSVQHDYTGTFWDSDATRYNHANVVSSGADWGSYVYLGGPGAGGKLGA